MKNTLLFLFLLLLQNHLMAQSPDSTIVVDSIAFRTDYLCDCPPALFLDDSRIYGFTLSRAHLVYTIGVEYGLDEVDLYPRYLPDSLHQSALFVLDSLPTGYLNQSNIGNCSVRLHMQSRYPCTRIVIFHSDGLQTTTLLPNDLPPALATYMYQVQLLYEELYPKL